VHILWNCEIIGAVGKANKK